MKWKDKPELILGAIRNRRGFLFRPLKIGNETRWFWWYEWREEVRMVSQVSSFRYFVSRWQEAQWVPVSWL